MTETDPTVIPPPAPRTEPRKIDPWLLTSIVIGACFLAFFAIFFDVFRELVRTWWKSATFNHAFLIFPISGYLIWQRRTILRSLPPSPYYWGLVPLIAAAAAWLVGKIAFVLIVQEFAVILMIQALALTLLGPRATRALAFPLFYLLVKAILF